MNNHFYYFLKPISTELTRILKELERAIYQSPRFMITHSRTLIEAIMEKVMIHENISNKPYIAIVERIRMLDEEGLINEEVKEALEKVHRLGNIAAGDDREFRFSESLMTWERIYIIVKWFVEVYGSHKLEVPAYEDPKMKSDSYDLEELHIRMERFEQLLKESIEREQKKEANIAMKSSNPNTTQQVIGGLGVVQEHGSTEIVDKAPGLTPVRRLRFKDKTLDIPHFLRDSFLLPQRFPKSKDYLISLNGVQEARIMSELPVRLDLLHDKPKRRTEKHTEIFLDELKLFIDEEIRRKQLIEKRPGELFLFYSGDEIVVTETFGEVDVTNGNFPGSPNMIKQLNEDGMLKIRHLPKEFIIIEKYKHVGPETVRKFFHQIQDLQRKKIEELNE